MSNGCESGNYKKGEKERREKKKNVYEVALISECGKQIMKR